MTLDAHPMLIPPDTIARLNRAVREAMIPMTDAIARFNARARTSANDPVRVAGLQARYLVRGGLDPAYADEAAVGVLCRLIATGGEPGTRLLTRTNRSLVAAAALQGWSEGR